MVKDLQLNMDLKRFPGRTSNNKQPNASIFVRIAAPGEVRQTRLHCIAFRTVHQVQRTSFDAAESIASFLRDMGVGIVDTGRRGRAGVPPKEGMSCLALPPALLGAPPPAAAAAAAGVLGPSGVAAAAGDCSSAPASRVNNFFRCLDLQPTGTALTAHWFALRVTATLVGDTGSTAG